MKPPQQTAFQESRWRPSKLSQQLDSRRAAAMALHLPDFCYEIEPVFSKSLSQIQLVKSLVVYT